MSRLRLVLLLLPLLLLFGCATPSGRIDRAKSFTYQTLQYGSAAVMGVTSITEQLSEPQADHFAALLLEALRQQRPELEFLPATEVVERLGDSYRPLMQGFRQFSVLDKPQLLNLRKRLPKRRFLILARVSEDMVLQSSSEQPLESAEEGSSGGVRVTLDSQRKVGVFFSVYDLRLLRAVWSGTLTRERSNQSSYDQQASDEEQETGFLGNVLDKQLLQQRTFPIAPLAERVLREVFAGFAESLPSQ